jgi:hypothetical protein
MQSEPESGVTEITDLGGSNAKGSVNMDAKALRPSGTADAAGAREHENTGFDGTVKPVQGFASLSGADGHVGDPHALDFIEDRVDELARFVLAAQGPAAFECSKRSAAVHEAGHCIITKALGQPVTRTKIERRNVGERVVWLGETLGPPAWECTPETDPRDDFREGISLIAGFIAEVVFDGDNLRFGSSLNEIAVTNAIAHNIAVKLKADPSDVMRQIMAAAGDTLLRNADAVRAIAERLERKRTIDGPRLAKMLAGVERLRRGR